MDYLNSKKKNIEDLDLKSSYLSSKIYRAIDQSGGQFCNNVPKRGRSNTVVVFKLKAIELIAKFLLECKENGFCGNLSASGNIVCYISFQTSRKRVNNFAKLIKKFSIHPKI